MRVLLTEFLNWAEQPGDNQQVFCRLLMLGKWDVYTEAYNGTWIFFGGFVCV